MNKLLVCWYAVSLSAGVPAVTSALAESEDLSVFKGMPEFSTASQMLPNYLMKLALERLEERKQRVEQLATAEDVARRRSYVRERIVKALGGFPERTPLNPKVVGTLDRDGYKIDKVIFESQLNFFVTANLYVPKTGTPPYPGILFPLGHEAGAKAHHAWQSLLITFAKNGFVVLTYDPIGQGERIQNWDADFKESKVGASTTEHTVIGIQCLLTGQNLARYTIWDGMRALDYLLSRKEVDATRIGCTGNSGGGTHTAYLSALDDRINVAAPSCYITSWKWLLKTIGPQDAEQCMPPFLRDGLDQPDFVEAFAPKPYLILSAIRDFFPIEGARESFREARQIYRLMKAEEKLSMVEVDDGHGYSLPRRLAAYRWMNRWLKGRDVSLADAGAELETEETLSCTSTGQVQTSLGGETVFSLNLKHHQAILPKPKTLSDSRALADFQKELRQQVTQLTGFQPHQSPLNVRSFGEVRRQGYRIEKLVYESEPGIVVPALLFVPNSTVERKPAVLYVHGRDKSADAEVGEDIEKFVGAGALVLALDLRGSGESQVTRNPDTASDFYRYFGEYESAMTSLLLGKTLVGLRAQDIFSGLDLLSARSDVDPAQILGFGKGDGAIALLHVAVLDDRIKKLALQDMLVSYESIVTHKIHQRVFESVIPGVLQSYDLPDLVAALPPRPVWIVNSVDTLGNLVQQNELSAAHTVSSGSYRMMTATQAFHLRQANPGEPFERIYAELLGR
jgi:cephalosporin-C deacetylase-like acetyl esterase